jgi:hypothetical protein
MRWVAGVTAAAAGLRRRRGAGAGCPSQCGPTLRSGDLFGWRAACTAVASVKLIDSGLLIFAALTLLGSPGYAWAEAEAEAEPSAEQPTDHIDLRGRVFARSTTSRVDLEGISDEPWTHAVSVASARLNVRYRPSRALRAVVKVEFAGGRSRLRDGNVRYRPIRAVSIQAGRFKRPMSAISLESRWRLPVVERGLLNDLEPSSSVGLPFGGRADGISLALRGRKVFGRPEVQAAVFAHEVDDLIIDASRRFALDAYGRARLEPIAGVVVGASVAAVTHRSDIAARDASALAPVGGLDVAVKARALRLWLEGFAGESTVYAVTGATRGRMWAARAIASLRLNRPMAGLRRVEPFVTASIFDPNTLGPDDRAYEAGGGLALMLRKDLRLQADLRRVWIDDPGLLRTADRVTLHLQLGTRF